MARTGISRWNIFNTTYITPDGSYDLLLNGSNHYLNFGTLSGSSGYGFRDNLGTMEFKNSGGSWTGLGSGGGTVGPGTINEIAYFDSANTVASLSVATYPSLAELSYVKGVTSVIQTQFTAKANLTTPVFVTNITTPLIYGSSAANGDITIEGTSDATKTTSYVILQPTSGNVGIGTVAGLSKLSINGGLHVGGDSDAGDNNILADGTITATGNGNIVGNLLIGQAGTAVVPLQVHAATDVNFGLRTSQILSNGIQFNSFNDAADTNIPIEYKSSQFLFSISGGSNMLIDTTGYVGIGTMAPATPLQIVKAGTGTQTALTVTTSGSNVGDGGAIDFGFASTVDMIHNNARIYSSAVSGYSGDLRFATNPNTGAVAMVDRMSILGSNGNVGIGTTGPVAPLDIFRASAVNGPMLSIRSDFTAVGKYAMIRFGDQSQTTNYQKGAIIYEGVSAAARGRFHIALNNDDTSASVALSDARLTVQSDGNVGIGTTVPDKKLEINLGTANALRLSYNDADGSAATYMDTTISSAGLTTFTGVGSAPTFTFAQAVTAPTFIGALTGTASGNLTSGGALGTPSSGTGTNITGIPAANILAGSFGAGAFVISTSLQAATIELGHATDTTLARVSAGVISVEGVTIPTISSTSTFTNKRITKREVTTTDDATAVIDVDVTDVYELSAVANATTFSTTGTPTDGQPIIIRFKDAGVAKGLTWDAIFAVVGVTLPTTTVAGKWHYVGATYNTVATKWHVLAVSVEA